MLAEALGNVLNRGLPRSPRARQLVAGLAGRSLALAVPAVTRVRVSSDGHTLAVTRDDLPADATIEGGLASLLAFAAGGDPARAQQGGVHVDGDAEVAQRFRELLQRLRPDPEEELAQLVGDVPAHQLARLGGHLVRFGRGAAATGLRSLAEYLGHERGDLVSRSEGEQFLRGVDAVREHADRLEARLARLARQRGAT